MRVFDSCSAFDVKLETSKSVHVQKSIWVHTKGPEMGPFRLQALSGYGSVVTSQCHLSHIPH